MKQFTTCIIIIFFISFSSGQTLSNDERRALANEVKSEFLHAWSNYKAYAWGHDELRPLSKTYHDWYKEPLLMTPVDAFDTMILMGLKNEAQEAKHLILEKLKFDQDTIVSVFEINIRLLGGLLSAYELDGDPGFLKLAKDLGNRLLPAFNSPSSMPYPQLNLKTGAHGAAISNPAEIGTLLLEFGKLSMYTGDPIYYDKAMQGERTLFNHRSSIGLVGSEIDVETGKWKSTESHISGMIDSYYEYLLKTWVAYGDTTCKAMWDSTITAVNRYVADSCASGFW
jgi:mannosidase alpha-like ER degradation enhancer 2